ncbi:MAG: hypothetical protein ABI988_09710 [Nitrospirota bacterium]
MVSKSCPDHEIEPTPKQARCGDVLQSEVEAEGAGQGRHGAPVDAGRLEDPDEADGNDDIADDRAGLSTDPQIHADLGEEAGDDPDLQLAGDGEQKNNESDQYNERPKREENLSIAKRWISGRD